MKKLIVVALLLAGRGTAAAQQASHSESLGGGQEQPPRYLYCEGQINWHTYVSVSVTVHLPDGTSGGTAFNDGQGIASTGVMYDMSQSDIPSVDISCDVDYYDDDDGNFEVPITWPVFREDHATPFQLDQTLPNHSQDCTSGPYALMEFLQASFFCVVPGADGFVGQRYPPHPDSDMWVQGGELFQCNQNTFSGFTEYYHFYNFLAFRFVRIDHIDPGLGACY